MKSNQSKSITTSTATSDTLTISVRLSKDKTLEFEGHCLGRVVALNHDDSIRRQFSVYAMDHEYVAERIDNVGTLDSRAWGARCADAHSLYEFFGNEPLANYLYGRLGLTVPGLHVTY